MKQWLKEAKFDTQSMERIVSVINHYPMSLCDCANIIEAVAPLCRHKTSEGVIAELNQINNMELWGDKYFRIIQIY
mgnify:CR=1 FL=1